MYRLNKIFVFNLRFDTTSLQVLKDDLKDFESIKC